MPPQVPLRPGPFQLLQFHSAVAKLGSLISHGPSEPAKTGAATACPAMSLSEIQVLACIAAAREQAISGVPAPDAFHHVLAACTSMLSGYCWIFSGTGVVGVVRTGPFI